MELLAKKAGCVLKSNITPNCFGCNRGSIEEVKMQLTNQKHVSDTEREKSISRLTMEMGKQESSTKDRLVSK